MGTLYIFPLVFIFLLLYLGQALWVYLDSKKKGNAYDWLWGILSLISCPVPLIIYFIISRNGMKKCINCGKSVDKSSKICPYCGETPHKLCQNCGYIIESNWSFCPNCKEKLK